MIRHLRLLLVEDLLVIDESTEDVPNVDECRLQIDVIDHFQSLINDVFDRNRDKFFEEVF